MEEPKNNNNLQHSIDRVQEHGDKLLQQKDAKVVAENEKIIIYKRYQNGET